MRHCVRLVGWRMIEWRGGVRVEVSVEVSDEVRFEVGIEMSAAVTSSAGVEESVKVSVEESGGGC